MNNSILRRWFVRSMFLCAGATSVGCPGEPELAKDIFARQGEIIPSATATQRETFLRGKEVAERRFTPATGLGPSFNVSFCSGCHERPVTGGSAPRYRNFLLVGQVLSDGSFTGTGVNGVQPIYEPSGPVRRPTDPTTNIIATRNGIPFFGVGLLAELPDDAILANADPDDSNGDGISGRPNYDRGFVGRFGRKSQTVSIEGFIRGPLFNHLGITSNPLSDALKAALPVSSVGGDQSRTLSGLRADGIGQSVRGQAAAPEEPTTDDDDAPDPELSEQDLFDLVSFSMLLAAPQPDAPTAQTEAGFKRFEELGCAGCHVRGIEGPRGLIPLYSDLLLHDMGTDLADGIRMKEASASEFRTQPLWGLASTGPYLHDGRADTIDEAIRLHGGEGKKSRDAYVALSDADRTGVLAFLESLGGRAEHSDGLVPPNAPVLEVGAYGGPIRALSAEESARFVRGRALFDRDIPLAGGLGPEFNGDSCRACHFDPVIGGAGPADLNVIRHGNVAPDGTFTPPAQGTMAHRLLARLDGRAPADVEASSFELRQTPALFGLGLVDKISDATILALEDPDDLDGDGIRGFARRLDDGRIGRLGWKLGVPSLAEFARDALSNELGVTVPADASSPFGFIEDDDDAPDPELDAQDIGDLVFFMEMLAPPPRTSEDAAKEARGEALFTDAGCNACHVPSLPTEDGTPVPLYSDLLLHDVSPAGALGIADGSATIRHFRTAPLWGIAKTGPYMHDGQAYSVEEAIARHASEGEASRTAYEMMNESERDALLAFLRSL